MTSIEDSNRVPIRALHRLGDAYAPERSPWTLFLDLIGHPHLGHYDWETGARGYLELGAVADALRVYANWPEQTTTFVTVLVNEYDDEEPF